MANEPKKVRPHPRERQILKLWVASRTLPRRQVERAKILLAAARGESSRSIAKDLKIARGTVLQWIARYEAEGLEGIERDRPRSGRPRKVSPEVEEAIVQKTIREDPPPEVATHWSSWLLAKAMRLNHVDVWTVWRKYGLKPHQVRRFKLSRDPRLVETIHDVVGLYLNSPANAVVFSLDETSQTQASDRTQPGLPLKRGRAGTVTHDYKRHGTTTIFAALNVAARETLHECIPRHRAKEFLTFLKKLEAGVEPGLELHVILDNYVTQKHKTVRAWLKRHPHVHLHFVPTGASWLHLVESLFSELEERQLKRLAVPSVDQLKAAILAYLDTRNQDPKPFVWTKDAKSIIEKIERGLRTVATAR